MTKDTIRVPVVDFALTVARARHNLGLTREEVAVKTGGTANRLARLERYGVPPTSKRMVVKLATALDLSSDYLFYLLGWLPPDRRRDMTEAEVEQAMGAFREMN